MTPVLVRTTRLLSRLVPVSVDASNDRLEQQLSFLNLSLAAETVLRAGYAAGVLTSIAFVACGLVAGLGLSTAGAVGVAIGFAMVHGIHRTPATAATIARTSALCAASDLVGRVVLHARLTGAVEPSAVFAARTGDGVLARSLDDHLHRTAGNSTSGLTAFAAAWQPWFPALSRAVELVDAAVDAPQTERAELLDAALSTVVEATHEQMSSFAATIRGPATAVYAFGVLLPLALVGVLPAARVAGLMVSLPLVAVVYEVLLPLGLVGASVWVVARRPVTFVAPPVPRAHPDASVPSWHPVAAGVVVGGLFWVVASTVAGAWAAPPTALSSGVGAALVARFRPAIAVSENARAVEDGLADALSLVGRRVRDGESVEAAVAAAGRELSGATGELFAAAAALQRRLGVTLDEAFLGEYGVLAHMPSPRVRAAATLVSVAAVEGRPAGETLVSMADQFRALDRAERDGKRELAAVSGTLANTAAVFGPLVGGATVALAARMASVDTGGSVGTAFSISGLGTVLSGYVFVMAATLTLLSTSLESGLDRTRIAYRVGLALVLAAVTFLVGLFAADVLV